MAHQDVRSKQRQCMLDVLDLNGHSERFPPKLCLEAGTVVVASRDALDLRGPKGLLKAWTSYEGDVVTEPAQCQSNANHRIDVSVAGKWAEEKPLRHSCDPSPRECARLTSPSRKCRPAGYDTP